MIRDQDQSISEIHEYSIQIHKNEYIDSPGVFSVGSIFTAVPA